MKRRYITDLFAAILLLSHIGSSQTTFDVSLTNMYDDNVNNNAEQWKSAVSSLNVAAEHLSEMEHSDILLSYDGAFHYFASLLSRTNQFHSGNILYSSYTGDDGENRFRLGGSVGYGDNRDAFTVFDHSLISVSSDYKYFVTERFILTPGYLFRSISFPSLPEFSYSEHAVGLKGAFAVTQQTTLIVNGDLGTKYYSTAVSGTGSALRKGVMSSILPSVTQATGLVKLGQAITDNIGVGLAFRYQWNIQKQTRYLSSDYGFISDDELFDDHYGYEGLHTTLLYTHLLSETVTGRVTGGIQNKIYSSLSAYDLTGVITATQRIDRRTYLNLLLEKHFIDQGFILKTSLDLIDNASNDAYYDYENSAVTLEIDIPF